MPDGSRYYIGEVKRNLMFLDGCIVKEINSSDDRRQAGGLVEQIEISLDEIEVLCQKPTENK